MTVKFPYSVKIIRKAGLEAKWTHSHSGKPIIAARNPQTNGKYFLVGREMWEHMQQKGIKEAFNQYTLTKIGHEI